MVLNDPAFYRDRYPHYAALRAKAPVLPVPFGGSEAGAVVVTGHQEAREALAGAALSKDTTAYFADKESDRELHPAIARNLLTTDPPEHTRLRRLVTRAFTTATVQRLRPAIEALARKLTADWAPGREVDLIEGLAAPLPVTVICELLGVPEADRDAIGVWSAELFVTGDHTRIDAASHALAAYMAGLIAAKRSRPDGALISGLIAARDGVDAPLDEHELLSLAILLLVAGHETTTAAIGNGVLALLRHPGAWQALLADRGRVPAAVDELLRYDAPVSIATWRWAPAATVLGGQPVPAGRPVFVCPGAANRDPARFPDPDRLDLDRPDAAAHLSFGHGVHRCLGAPLAHAELEITLRVLLERFPGMRLAGPAEELTWRHSRLFRGLTALPVLP
ncbi:cytochrome P450 [Kitasatospora sp. NPDC096147]|uniref:cytochrome P450 family protein n=1 Tax=Kitasatospora sp. NPDC096147 TaxID=3364093 RepID=UPI003815237D